MTIDAVKQKINNMTGTSVLNMMLHLKDESGRPVAVLSDDNKKLGYYSPCDGYVNCCTGPLQLLSMPYSLSLVLDAATVGSLIQ